VARRRRPATGPLAISEAFDELVDPRAVVERVATGFIWTEGPVWSAQARCLQFSDVNGDARWRWSAERGTEEVMRPSNKANGMAYDADGTLFVCEHVTSRVVRERPDGTRETIASHFRGKQLNSPNDVVVSSGGAVYFTDPSYGRMAGAGTERDGDLGFQGVYRIPPDGGPLELVVDEHEFERPNGLCFSPGESLLYVNDTARMHVKVYDVRPDGSLSNPEVFFEDMHGDASTGAPDGMKCDEHGNVWVTGPGGVWVISPRGEHLGTVRLPERPANLTWGGPEWRTLYMAASTSVYRIPTRVASTRLPHH
jgi:gluconolactonase